MELNRGTSRSIQRTQEQDHKSTSTLPSEERW